MVSETNLNMLDQHCANEPLKIALPQDMHLKTIYCYQTSALLSFLLTFPFLLLDYVFVTFHPKLLIISTHIHITAGLLYSDLNPNFMFCVYPFSNPTFITPIHLVLSPPPVFATRMFCIK